MVARVARPRLGLSVESSGSVGVHRRTLLREIPSTSTTADTPHFADRALIILDSAPPSRTPHLSNLASSGRHLSRFVNISAGTRCATLISHGDWNTDFAIDLLPRVSLCILHVAITHAFSCESSHSNVQNIFLSFPYYVRNIIFVIL